LENKTECVQQYDNSITM